MIIKQIWTANSYRNFNYLIACENSGEAVAVDPLAAEKCLAVAEENGWRITKIINTHEHYDHIGGNKKLAAATGAQILAHKDAAIDAVGVGLAAGDVVQVGDEELHIMDTPGHTMTHICLLYKGDAPALFCGDTLFNAGAGNCHNGGHPNELYQTFATQLAKLSDNTRVYPGHEYMETNLRFALDREPSNATAAELLKKITNQDPANALVTTIGLEKQINVFFRLNNEEVIAQLRIKFPQLRKVDDESVFLRLRELRNAW